jgi:hypothetical protein
MGSQMEGMKEEGKEGGKKRGGGRREGRRKLHLATSLPCLLSNF